MNARTEASATYTRPEIRDHGSLEDLTADFDLHFVGSVARVATMAMASHPGQGHGNGPPDTPPGGGQGDPGGGGGRPFSVDSSGGDGIPTIGGDGGDFGRAGRLDQAGAGDLGAVPSAAGAGGAPGTLPGAGGSGELPFTGYRAGAVASLGAAMTVAGMTLRSKLNRLRR